MAGAKEREKRARKAREKRAAYRLANPLPPRLTEEEKTARRKASRAAWYKKNKEKHHRDDRAWRQRNKDRVAAYTRQYAKDNRGIVRKAQAKYSAQRKAYYYAKTMERIARKKQAVARWGNSFFIEEIYALARLRSKLTGHPWHVDHIVPLQSPIVCGLHVEHNLQVVPATVNQSKSNRHWPDMP